MGPHIPGELIPIVLFMMIGLSVIFYPLTRALVRSMERKAMTSVPPEIGARLERIEQAVDAIAIEVERISEGQRFTTQLLGDTRKAGALGAGGNSPPHGDARV